MDVSVLPVTGETEDAPTPPPIAVAAAASVSGVTAKARQVFVQGQSMGNRPYVFSRVGDSITASPYFLTPFGGSSFDLGAYQNELIDVLNYFKGSFTRASLAAGNGWGADRILQPGYSHPDVCGADSPLEANLRQIVQISIDLGVVPVLSTIPPKQNSAWNAERANQWNAIIRMVAQQYEVPLMDYWAALQGLPNQGISEDGIHPSYPPDGATGKFTADHLQFGYTMRNLVALQALNAVWRGVIY